MGEFHRRQQVLQGGTLYEIYETIRDFLDRGGNVMIVIAWVVFVMWTLILERLIFMVTENRIGLKTILSERESRRDRHSWHARAIYDAAVSRVSIQFESGIQMIRTLARLCPLFGLMGTVTGMIIIFDVMAMTGSSSPRAMAAGVAKATLTTMAGMVGALSGIFPAAILGRLASEQQQALQMHRLTSAQIILSAISGLPKLVRLIIAPVAAFVITMGLLFLMQTLIEKGEAAIQKTILTEYVDFIRVRRDETTDTRDIKPKKIMPEDMPEKLDARTASDPEAGGIQIDFSIAAPTVGNVNLSGFGGDMGVPDGEFLPLVRVLPMYPRRAQQQGIEGWVLVEFTITTAGNVTNARVLESSHAIFETSALRAIAKFKYRPRIVNGQPIAVNGVKTKLSFDIED